MWTAAELQLAESTLGGDTEPTSVNPVERINASSIITVIILLFIIKYFGFV